MAQKKRGLGRGLDALMAISKDIATEPNTSNHRGTLTELNVNALSRGTYQPRREIVNEALEELANSIKAQGVMQPLIVRPIDHSSYEIIAGERRWRASKMAGLETVPVIIRDVPDEDAIAMALIENIQREDLNPIEEALALQRLQKEFELTQAQVADAVGKKRATVANLLRLLNLELDVKHLLNNGDIEMGHARALLTLDGPSQIAIAREVADKGMTVRQTEQKVRQLQQPNPRPQSKASTDANIEQLATKASELLGTQVQIKQRAKGKGQLVIPYNNLNELDGILGRMK